jgi:hypothetical protein
MLLIGTTSGDGKLALGSRNGQPAGRERLVFAKSITHLNPS